MVSDVNRFPVIRMTAGAKAMESDVKRFSSIHYDTYGGAITQAFCLFTAQERGCANTAAQLLAGKARHQRVPSAP